MTALIEKFHSLSKILDDVVRDVDQDLALADDIHPAIRRIGEYAAAVARLPVELAKLKAKKASAEASIPTREESVRKAKHALGVIESKLKKLNEGLDRNLNAASEEKPSSVAVTVPTGLAADLPASRQQYVEKYRADILAAEGELAKARDTLKRAEAFRKGVDTRVANLAWEILVAGWAIVDHEGRLEETIKVLRKTINHLRNRQEKRDRKRAPQATAIETVDQTAAEAPKGPTDEDIRKMAAAEGLTLESPDDFVAARQLFLN